MDWIKDNAVNLAAIFTALYTAARIIVLLTPTPKDDEALKKIGPFLKFLGTIFGLDLKRGVEKKK